MPTATPAPSPLLDEIAKAAGPSAAPHVLALVAQLVAALSGSQGRPRVRLSKAVEDWITFKSRTVVSKTTKNRTTIWRDWTEALADPFIADIRPPDVEKLFTAAKGSIGWLNYQGTVCRGFFRWAHRRGIIPIDPAAEVWPRIAGDQVRPFRELTEDEEEKIISASSPPLARFITVAAATGLRHGTLRQARWGWVTPDWYLEIPAAALKNRKTLRIPLNQRAIKALGERKDPEALLLPDLPHETNISRCIRWAARKAGVNTVNLHAHQLRKTWAARMAKAGAKSDEIQRIQGWGSNSVMLTHYFPAVPEQRARELVERIGER